VVGTSYQLSATGGGSTAPVVFSSATPDTCTVTGDEVSFVAVGTCTVNADQDGDTDYAPADTVSQDITVVPGSQTIRFTSAPPAHAVIGGHYTVHATGGASGNPVTFASGTAKTCAVAGATVTFKAAGGCTIIATQAGSTSYNPATPVSQRVTVHKLTEHPTIKVSSPKPGRLKVKVVAHPRVKGLTVKIYRHAHHHDHKIGTTHTNRHGVAIFTHREKRGTVLRIRARLAASATTTAAHTGVRKVRIKNGLRG
jgi:hypothetical protein